MTDIYEALDSGVEASECEIAKVLRSVADEIESDTTPDRDKWIRALAWCLDTMKAGKETEAWEDCSTIVHFSGFNGFPSVPARRPEECTCGKATAECLIHLLRR